MDPSLSNALQGYYDRERASIATAHDVRAALRERGVARVQAEYDGVGDSGQIEQIQYLSGTEPSQPVEVDEKLNELVETLLYALLNLRHGGWENNDGADGHFFWDLVSDALEHEHHQRYTDSSTFVHEGFDVTTEDDT